MPVRVVWDDDAQTIIRWDYEGKWTWVEVSTAFETVVRLMRSVDHTVCIIHDLSRSAGLPGAALTNARRFTAALPENWDISVVVGAGTFIESVLSVFSKVYQKLGARYRTARSLDEARALIAQHRSK